MTPFDAYDYAGLRRATEPRPCGCRFEDSWECAKDLRLKVSVCQCPCHGRKASPPPATPRKAA